MTKTDIQNYLLANPINRNEQNPYAPAAKALGIDKEIIRRQWRTLREKGLVENEADTSTRYYAVDVKEPQPSFTITTSSSSGCVTYKGADGSVSKEVSREIKNELDLAEECDIDLSVWTITEWECKSYNAWIKNKNGEIESQPKFSVYAKMKRKKLDEDLPLQKQELLKELMDTAPELMIFELFPDGDDALIKDTLYEISMPDVHFGKLAWGEETGEDFDLKIACERYEKALNELLSRPNLARVEKILFPIGNDMINIDSDANTTTAGTPQSVDGRFPKIIKVVKELLIRNITKLSLVAPVDVIVVPGNHDTHTMFMIGEILEAYFHNTERINIFNSPNARKYYKYGENGFQYTHGNEEKHMELGLIFATEEPELWASTKYRSAKLGHFHKSKKISFTSVDEYQGFQVEVLPSLSGTDRWHKKKGYMSLKAAKAFLYHQTKGKIAEFTYNL